MSRPPAALTLLVLYGACACAEGGAGDAGPGSRNGPGSPEPIACTAERSRAGEATYYTFAHGSGNCSFDPTPDDLMVGAMNATDYAGASACGACARLDGPNGTVTVRLVDQCPECPEGNIDLSPEAFDRIAERSAGRVPIDWHYVPCGLSVPLAYRFKEGSNQWWTAVQVRRHENRIAKLEYEKDGTFVEVHREDYNYFVEPSGMGPGPYTFRVTDAYGNTVVDEGVEHREAEEVVGSAQFPDCSE